jgi:hypothetical protein
VPTVASRTGDGAGPGGGTPVAGPRTGIAITQPVNGHRVSRDEPPVIVVRGRVEDRDATSVVVTVNGLRITAPVMAGTFESIVPALEPVVRLRAEVAGAGNPRRSQEVTVSVDSDGPTAVILLDWGRPATMPELQMRATWRSQADRVDSPTVPVTVKPVPAYPRAFFIQNMKAGVYALALGYRATDVPLAGTLYLGGGGAKAAEKPLRGLRLNGSGRAILARLLLPFGVLWDEDEWFTGRSESVDTITKFRLPDGVSWVEQKGRR